MAKKTTEQRSIEEQLKRLEEIGDLLDRGTLPLEEQLAIYEEGVVLARQCREYIEGAQARIITLSQDLRASEDASSTRE
ncbi:MAG: exodeoxyribonuclease VII small subunit [Bradyrhizobiaceae bacterium]|nr:exodeoxyribonuclease VII small subunit [Bradyrhizobiaceae bacterium]